MIVFFYSDKAWLDADASKDCKALFRRNMNGEEIVGLVLLFNFRQGRSIVAIVSLQHVIQGKW